MAPIVVVLAHVDPAVAIKSTAKVLNRALTTPKIGPTISLNKQTEARAKILLQVRTRITCGPSALLPVLPKDVGLLSFLAQRAQRVRHPPEAGHQVTAKKAELGLAQRHIEGKETWHMKDQIVHH